MKRHEQVLQQLESITDDQWRATAKRCKDHIRMRTYMKTAVGAHSSDNLGMSPFDYYYVGAVEKLFKGTWDWKFELYSIEVQIIRIIDSMISDEIRKTFTAKKQSVKLNYVDAEENLFQFPTDIDIQQTQENEKEFNRQISMIQEAIKGDRDLELLFLCIQQGYKPSEIAREMNIDIKAVYKVTERLKEKTKKIISQNR